MYLYLNFFSTYTKKYKYKYLCLQFEDQSFDFHRILNAVMSTNRITFWTWTFKSNAGKWRQSSSWLFSQITLQRCNLVTWVNQFIIYVMFVAYFFWSFFQHYIIHWARYVCFLENGPILFWFVIPRNGDSGKPRLCGFNIFFWKSSFFTIIYSSKWFSTKFILSFLKPISRATPPDKLKKGLKFQFFAIKKLKKSCNHYN